jgi:hypothetical protein
VPKEENEEIANTEEVENNEQTNETQE